MVPTKGELEQVPFRAPVMAPLQITHYGKKKYFVHEFFQFGSDPSTAKGTAVN